MTNNIDKEIGARIKFHRRAKNISQAQLAKSIGFKSATALHYLESGKRMLGVSDLLDISRVLGVSVYVLLGHYEWPASDSNL